MIQLQNRKMLEFEELNKWERHTDTIFWTVTSIYLTINIILIGTIIEHWAIMQGMKILGAAISLGFIIIWDLILWLSYNLIRKGIQLKYRIFKLGRNWHGFLGSSTTSRIVKLRKRTGLLQNIFQSPFGVLIFFSTFVFIVIWEILFFYFIDVVPIN